MHHRHLLSRSAWLRVWRKLSNWNASMRVHALLSLVCVMAAADAHAIVPRARVADALRVAPIFASGMVLQRHQPITVWGWAAPGTEVRVALRGGAGAATRSPFVSTRAIATGAWKVRLPAKPAGGPYTLRVSTGAQTVDFSDVLIGDVWLASGQSNMEWPLARDRDLADALAHVGDNGNATAIREFKVPVGHSFTPDDSLFGGAWTPADSAHAPAMSAVAYYFARALRASPTVGPRVPIGIINSTWGGSAIETWLSREALRMTAADMATQQRSLAQRGDSIARALRATLGELPTTDAGLVDGVARWASPQLDQTAWRPVSVPGFWEGQGYAGMDGIGWYRTTFTLTPAEAQGDVVLHLDAIDDDDITWVNGVEVGRTDGYQVQRRYVVPARVLRAGANQLTVRVADGAGGGGINGAVSLRLADGTSRSLAGTWAFRVGTVSFAADGQVINKIPAVVYNRMMHPLEQMPVAGVLWYQGESNANNDAQARAYRAQFATLITIWRRARQAPRLPFLWVQLPNYGTPDREPPASAAWALLRESMESALALPATGQAVIIDLGDANDIHPRQKRPVGERLAKVAERVAYRASLDPSGPTYRAQARRGDTLVVTFAHVAGGLRGADRLQGFAIAGADRRFVWANARIVGNRVQVWSDQVRAPVAVRYAWSNSPTGLTLRNTLELPAAPFRTDRW